MDTSEKKVLSRVYGNGRGYAFSSNDFIDKLSINNIDKALSSLTKKEQTLISKHLLDCYDIPLN